MQYCERYGLDPELAGKLAAGFGGGMSIGKTCGALSGAIMVLGLEKGFYAPDTSPVERQVFREQVTELIRMFEREHGTIDCTKLLNIDLSIAGNREKARDANISHTHCSRFIGTAIMAVDSIIADQGRVSE